MTFYDNPKIAAAAVVQVQRVNEFADLDELNRQLQDALEQVRLLRRDNNSLRDRLAEYEGDGVIAHLNGYVETPTSKTYNGRPVMMLEEATLKTGVNYWTIYRYVTTGTWQGVQLPDRRWLLFADQPLNRRSRTKR